MRQFSTQNLLQPETAVSLPHHGYASDLGDKITVITSYVKRLVLNGLKYFNPLMEIDAHCCHMGTAIKYPVLDHNDRVKPSSVIFDIQANDGLTWSDTGCFITVPIWQQWASKG